jgi:hypothetical protein
LCAAGVIDPGRKGWIANLGCLAADDMASRMRLPIGAVRPTRSAGAAVSGTAAWETTPSASMALATADNASAGRTTRRPVGHTGA